MINLIDLLKTKGISFDNYKIHIATGVVEPPLDAFLDGKFKEWHGSKKILQNLIRM